MGPEPAGRLPGALRAVGPAVNRATGYELLASAILVLNREQASAEAEVSSFRVVRLYRPRSWQVPFHPSKRGFHHPDWGCPVWLPWACTNRDSPGGLRRQRSRAGPGQRRRHLECLGFRSDRRRCPVQHYDTDPGHSQPIAKHGDRILQWRHPHLYHAHSVLLHYPELWLDIER
jgi:hypothetical protein